MNKSHYVSLEMAKLLAELEINFPETEKVWAKFKRTGELGDLIFDKFWHLESRRLPNDKYAYQYKIIPAPSLLEVLDRLGPAYSTCFNSDWIWNSDNNTESDPG